VDLDSNLVCSDALKPTVVLEVNADSPDRCGAVAFFRHGGSESDGIDPSSEKFGLMKFVVE
jgi:hypothetical protein